MECWTAESTRGSAGYSSLGVIVASCSLLFMWLYEEEAHCLDYLILSFKLNKPKPMWLSLSST